MHVWKSLALIITCVCTAAYADGKSERTAIDALQSAYAPIAKSSGAARVTAACTDAAKLLELNRAVSGTVLPAGAPVDLPSWRSARDGTIVKVTMLGEACKAPDHRYKILNKPVSADDLLVDFDKSLGELVDLGKARTLPPALETFRATFAATAFPSKQFCSQIAKLAKQAPAFARAPAGANATTWKDAFEEVKATVADLKCGPKAADEEIASGFDDLRTSLTALIRVIPPS